MHYLENEHRSGLFGIPGSRRLSGMGSDALSQVAVSSVEGAMQLIQQAINQANVLAAAGNFQAALATLAYPNVRAAAGFGGEAVSYTPGQAWIGDNVNTIVGLQTRSAAGDKSSATALASSRVTTGINQANQLALSGNFEAALTLLAGLTIEASAGNRSGDLASAQNAIRYARDASQVAKVPMAPVAPVGVPSTTLATVVTPPPSDYELTSLIQNGMNANRSNFSTISADSDMANSIPGQTKVVKVPRDEYVSPQFDPWVKSSGNMTPGGYDISGGTITGDSAFNAAVNYSATPGETNFAIPAGVQEENPGLYAMLLEILAAIKSRPGNMAASVPGEAPVAKPRDEDAFPPSGSIESF